MNTVTDTDLYETDAAWMLEWERWANTHRFVRASRDMSTHQMPGYPALDEHRRWLDTNFRPAVELDL